MLKKKGVDEDIISSIRNMYGSRISVPVINNIAGKGIANIRGTLAQGCPNSMNWFSFGIDPLLIYLENRLEGIPIFSLPVLGPPLQGQARPAPIEEKYKVIGYADDVKPGVSNMAEFATVERAAQLFEQSSGNKLHRDPLKRKCKVLLLGRWIGTVEQEDIGFPHLKITDSLAFVGVHLQASWQKSRKQNNDELLDRAKKKIAAWKSGKFLPLVCRPFSLNTYALSRVWFRTHSVDLRVGDISTLSSLCKSYLYQDMLEKPSELVLFRKVDQGGLGLHNVKHKALAALITTFLQTAANPKFQRSLFHNSLYRSYVLMDDSILKPDLPPYYNQTFFDIIRKVKDHSPLNPIQMNLSQWYNYLVEEFVTMEVVDDEGRMQAKRCRVELLYPQNDWQESFNLARVRGLPTDTRSFCFKLLHQLLPFNARLHTFISTTNPLCQLCEQATPDTPEHGFFMCDANQQAGNYITHLIRPYDSNITQQRCLLLNLMTAPTYELMSILILATGLATIWNNRHKKKQTSPFQIRTDLECLISLLRKSRARILREAGSMIENTLNNFPFNC